MRRKPQLQNIPFESEEELKRLSQDWELERLDEVSAVFWVDENVSMTLDCYFDMKRALRLVDRFKETTNPVYAAKAFCHCVESGLCPPPELMSWVSSSFESVLSEEGGNPNLSDAFGFKKGRGKESHFAAYRKSQRNYRLLRSMLLLVGGYGVKPEDAANMVARREEERHQFDGGRSVSDSTLLDLFYRTRDEEFRQARERALARRKETAGGNGPVCSPTVERVRAEKIREFPADSIPAVLKRRFSIQ